MGAGKEMNPGWTVCVGGVLSAAALVALMWQWAVARRFPLGTRRDAAVGGQPSMVVLKPLRGVDTGLRGALETWLEQGYAGEFEVLFGVSDEGDPAAGLVKELLARGSDRGRGRLVICPEDLGANRKVSTLIQLARQARGEIWVVSDGDVAAPRDLLTQLAAHLGEPGVGLVNCLYRFASPRNAAMQCEAAAVNIDFWSQVLQSRSLGQMDYALGAVMAIRRDWLGRAGGFEAVADHLADDFQLGNRITRAGGRIVLCPVVVDCWEALRGWREVWDHQVRWARTIRVSRPVPWFCSLLSNATLWPVGWVAGAGFGGWLGWEAGWCGGWLAAVGAGLVLGLRGVQAWDLQRRFVPEVGWRVPVWMVWVKDGLAVLTWLASFLGNTVKWRGRTYRVDREGRLRA
jgi:ceramide glucosyltransferase